jgi:hypothetical protein
VAVTAAVVTAGSGLCCLAHAVLLGAKVGSVDCLMVVVVVVVFRWWRHMFTHRFVCLLNP